MRAIRVSGPNDAKCQSVALRDAKAGEVLVRVRATGICGTDLEILDGSMPYYTRGLAFYPVTPGHEWAGQIEVIGTDVTGFEIGDHVVGECSIGCGECTRCVTGAYHRCLSRTETGILNRDGGFAEYLIFPARYLHRIDDNIDIRAAALVEPTAVAANGLKLGLLSEQDNLAIYGDGPIGLLVLLVARAFGARKIVVVGAHTERLKRAARLGADAVIDARSQDVTLALQAQFEGALPDLAVEATGQPDAAGAAISNVSPGGRVVLQGLFAGRKLSEFDLDQVVINDLSIKGALGSPNIWPEVINMIEQGQVDPLLIVTHELPLDRFLDGVELAKSRQGIKVLITQPDEPLRCG
ncbi:MAG: alcohol dehydrogenase catalytic domain-containing protein [Paracoccaceae bacterium]